MHKATLISECQWSVQSFLVSNLVFIETPLILECVYNIGKVVKIELTWVTVIYKLKLIKLINP